MERYPFLFSSVTFSYLKDFFVGRRRTYDDEEMGCVYTIRQNEEGYSFREIDPTELRVESQLGSGAFGKVYKGYWRNAEVVCSTSTLLPLLVGISHALLVYVGDKDD